MPRLQESHVKVFLKPYRRKTRLLQPFVLAGGMFVLVIGLYLLLNASALNRIRPIDNTPNPSQIIILPSETPTTSTPTENPTSTPTSEPTQASLPNDTLILSDLNISAPIIWGVNFYDDSVYQKLQSGIIQFSGTPKPGNQGMVVIFGHSSYYPWAKGSYKNIFAPLVKAQAGQIIKLRYGDIDYQYQVTKSYEVPPDQVEILNSPTNISGIRLITCTPIGTSLRRLIVEAEQTQPNPNQNSSFSQDHFTGQLPTDQ